MKPSTESHSFNNTRPQANENDYLFATHAVGRHVVTGAPPVGDDAFVRAIILVSQFGQTIPIDMTGSLEQVRRRHDGLVQRLVERWFTCPDDPNEHAIQPGEVLRGPTLSSPSVSDVVTTFSQALIGADADAPTGSSSVRHRILEHLSKGSDNWYGIHRAVGTTKARCILGLEKAWGDGLLLRERVAAPRALAKFALSEHGNTAWHDGTLGWPLSVDNREWDRWKSGPEPWTLHACPLCGRDLVEVSVGHLGDNWEHEECLATHCCHVDFAEVRLSGSRALMDMHYTAYFRRGILVGEYADHAGITVDVDHVAKTTTRSVNGTEHQVPRTVGPKELRDLIYTLVPFT